MKNILMLLLMSFTLALINPTSAQTTTKDSTAKTLVSNVVKSDNLIVYPNPSSGLFCVRIPSISPESNISITVYDQKGDIVMMEEGTGNIAMVDINEQPTGIYTVYVAGDGIMARQRVSVVK